MVYGDLWPVNILLYSNEDIKLGDFDLSDRLSRELRVKSEPFSGMNKDIDTPIVGPVRERLSFASCIYIIFFGYWP